MKVLTINDLYEQILVAIKNGLGDKKILLSGDDEGNSFHQMFFAVSDITDDYAYCLLPVDIQTAKEEYVIVG